MSNYPYRWMPKPSENTKFIFRNQAMKDLWNEELSGQLSDGKWENSWRGTHSNDYAYYNMLPTEVGLKTELINFNHNVKKITGYNSTDLVECVGDRMLKIVQKSEPDATMKTLRKYLREISQAVREA